MNLNEFINHNKNCIVCGHRTMMIMAGTMQEKIENSAIHCIFSYMIPVVRKEFTTFAVGNFALFTPDELIDVDTLNREKYETFSINKDGYVKFDLPFQYKMKLTLKVMCHDQHYSYSSRMIRISNKSPDITKGYPISTEEIAFEKYKVISNLEKKQTSIFNFNASKKPVVVQYMDVASFPREEDKFVKKVQNILLLA